MTTKEQTCENRIDSAWESVKADLTAYMEMRDPWAGNEELPPFNEYGLSFYYVTPHTFTDQTEGYWRYQMSWGGPSDEIRFYGDSSGFMYKASYWFLDWMQGANRDVTREPCIKWLWEDLVEVGAVKATYDEAMADYEEPESEEDED